MSYALLSEIERTACKAHRCIWCPEKINAGEKYLHEKSVYEGDMQDHKWHHECRKASELFFKTEGPEWEPHEFQRGTIEEARHAAKDQA